MEADEELYDINSLCRICLERLPAEASFDLFEVPGLAKKLALCASLTVETNDGYPKYICGVCYTRLNDLYEFQKLCVDSVQRFQAMVDSKVFVAIGSTATANEFDMLEGSTTMDVANFADTELPNAGADDDERVNYDPLLNHKIDIIEHDDVVKMLECVEEQSKLDRKEEIDSFDEEDNQPLALRLGTVKKKTNKKQGINNNNNKQKKLNKKSEQNKKTIANDAGDKQKNKEFDNVAAAVDEDMDDDEDIDDDEDEDDDDDEEDSTDEEADDDLEFIADGENSLDNNKPKRRKRSERGPKQTIECHICQKKFKKVTRYHNHMKYHNDKLPHQCTVPSCLRGFTTPNGLRLHVEHCHSETIELLCCPEEGCDRKFPRTRLLNWHLKKVHKRVRKPNEPKCYPCTGCEKVFRCPMSLKKHLYKHDGKELPFPCNICGKRFVINSALKDHLMRHAGIKNYVCPYCGVGKTTRQEWNTHIATHTQEKQFKCHLCPHASHNKQNLRMHIKIVHEKIKDYACQYCGKTFGKSNACKMHEMTHTGEKRCECKVCGKRFLYAKSLTKHLKTHEKRVLRAIEVYRKRQIEIGSVSLEDNQAATQADETAAATAAPQTDAHSKETHQKVADEILKVCAESAATIPKNPRHVERVDIMELAGTAVNPIPSVAVPSWSPQINFMMKEGPHICPDCGQGFNGLGNLKRHHRIVHEGVKDFACRFCHKRFAKAQTLKHHEMTHTGEKPHECKHCGKRFIQVVALKRHLKVHGNAPPTIPTTVYEARVYEAREELELQERAELAAKYKAEEHLAVIAEAAKEQLNELEAKKLADQAQAEAYANSATELPTALSTIDDEIQQNVINMPDASTIDT